MERTVRTQRSLSKQDEIHEENDMEAYEENSQCASEVPNSKSSSSEDQSSLPLNNNTLHRSRSQNKVKLLVRSHAVREETSPPPDPHQDQCNLSLSTSSEQLPQPPQQQSTSNRRHKLRREGSSTETWEHPSLSRGNSREQQYDGSNQVDLHQFIVDTLNRNHKDRMLLLKIENDLVSLAKDPKRTVHKFAQMSSYQRMLVHRVAAYFSMEHNVDTSGVSVIVNTTKATRIPETRFRDFVRDDLLLPEEPRRSILKRDSSSFDETGSFKSGERMLNGDSRRSKSFEEREEEYEKARRRIFNREHSGEGDVVDCLDEFHWENEDGVCTQCEHPPIRDRNPRLLKVESYECGETLKANSLRLSVSKSHSFSGYDPPQQTRILTKQDSGSSMSSRISPSSSGYKSQRSDATLSATPSPTATPNLHTQTGQPYTNADGSIYHYDPSNPPRVCGSGENVGAQVAHHASSTTNNNIPSSTLPTQQQQQPPQQQPPPQQQQSQPQHQQKHGELCEPQCSDPGDRGNCKNDGNQEKPTEADKQQLNRLCSLQIPNLQHNSAALVENTSNYCLSSYSSCNPSTFPHQIKNETENSFVKSITNQINSVSNSSFVYSVEKSGTTYFYTASPVDQPNFEWSPLIEPYKVDYYSNEYCVLQEPTTASILYGQCLYF